MQTMHEYTRLFREKGRTWLLTSQKYSIFSCQFPLLSFFLLSCWTFPLLTLKVRVFLFLLLLQLLNQLQICLFQPKPSVQSSLRSDIDPSFSNVVLHGSQHLSNLM